MNPIDDDMTYHVPAPQAAYTTDDPSAGVFSVADLLAELADDPQPIDPAAVNVATSYIKIRPTKSPCNVSVSAHGYHQEATRASGGSNRPARPPHSCFSSYKDTTCERPTQLSKGHPEHPIKLAVSHLPSALRAFDIQHTRAVEMGQQWSVEHANAFRELHQAFVLTARGIHRGRTAWPFAVGTGKTQSLVAFAKAQSEVAACGGTPLSLLVCIERVDHIRDLHRDMINAGVPAEMIAVFHRKTPREVIEGNLVASAKPDEVSRFPFLIATHAFMLNGDDSIAAVNTYRGAERDLVVWDESLIKSQGRHFDLADIEGALGVLRPVVADSVSADERDVREAVEFIGSCLDQLRTEFTRTLAGNPPRTVELPKLSPEDEMRYRIGIGEALKRGDLMRLHSRLKLADFIEHVQRPVRVVPYLDNNRRVGVVHYLTRIPESLSRLIVLDASHNIRLLTSEHDSTLRTTTVDCRVKSFSRVRVRQIVQGAGRDKLDGELPRFNSPTTTKLLEALKGYPASEAVIVVTFKSSARDERKGLSHAGQLQRHMEKAGIDPHEKLSSGLHRGSPRFVFLTWGQHVGVSEYAYCQHVLCVGVLRRDAVEVASQIVGQRDDLLAMQASDPAAVYRVLVSEMFHNVVQAAGRGACRTTRDGQALPMTLTLLCNETFDAQWWEEAMPDVIVDEEKPTEKVKAAQHSQDVQAIIDVLNGLPMDNERIAFKTIKLAAGLASMRPDAFSRLLSKVAAPGWSREGRSFIRCPFA